jgi:hypothetical protein
MLLRDVDYSVPEKEMRQGKERTMGAIIAAWRGKEEDAVVHCSLFGDIVAERVCELRRSELNNRGGFSCGGCVVDMA